MRILHVKAPTPKHVENSLRGIRRARRKHFDAIDLDMQMTKDGVPVCTHWPRPMIRDGFRDPLRKIPRTRMVSEMTWHQVARLVAGRWPRRYRIVSVDRALYECARQGVTALLEPKGDHRFRDDAVWQHIASVADRVGAHVVVYALPENEAALDPARRAGFKAWVIR